MKPLTTILLLGILQTLAGATDKAYKITPNQTKPPLPYDLPAIGRTEAGTFDWQRYIDESKSKADRAFRALVASRDYGYSIPGGDTSNSAEMMRANLAANEFKRKCRDLIRRYRLKLHDQPEHLNGLNKFIHHSEQAIVLQSKLVGGSWGGSGARVALASSLMTAYLNFHRNLRSLGDSLHLQDLPE